MDIDDTKLTITSPNKPNGPIIDIPLVHYLKMLQIPTSDKSINRGVMPTQEFLDRQDQYSIMLYLDKNLIWLRMEITVDAWTIGINNTIL